jgi:predicted RNA binding protein YcfA (HicA-like mRNA interferase family)
MPKLPVLKPSEVIRVLERNGFTFTRAKGGHQIYTKGSRGVIIAFHRRDLKRGTLHSIIKQTGLTVDEFIQLLRS